MTKNILIKAAQIIGFLNQNPNINLLIQNLKIITYYLSNIQILFPLLFHEFFMDYAQMSLVIIEKFGFGDENLLKVKII
jgi:hypothetical protein